MMGIESYFHILSSVLKAVSLGNMLYSSMYLTLPLKEAVAPFTCKALTKITNYNL